MEENVKKSGVSMFTRNTSMLENDPLEEIFALNLGDFMTEHLISADLAKKISIHTESKITALKKQLKELISIYSLDNTLKVLGFSNKEDYVIYNSIAKTIIQMIDVDACHVFLSKEFAKGLDIAGHDLVLVGSSFSFDKNFNIHKIGYKLNESSFVVDAFNSKSVLKFEDVRSDEKFKPLKDLNEFDSEFYMVIPIHNNTESLGAIVLENNTKRVLSNEYIELISSSAKLFATSILLQQLTDETSFLIIQEDASLHQLQHLRAVLTSVIGDLGEEQQRFVESLATAVDAKNHSNTNQSRESANMAKEICTVLKLNEKTKDLIYYAALLQNIGKITLPEELFNKTGKLNDEDWQNLQNHPNVGVSLLMNINFLSEVIPYIHYYRERWDGAGTPEGLSGQSIPLGSRIIAVSDAYVSMITNRPYREALSKDKALEILQAEAGSKWDPMIADALVSFVKGN